MGNLCKGKAPRVPPDKSIEEHKKIRRNLKMGLEVSKNDQGEIMVGVRASGEKFRDNVVIVGENITPAVKDLVENKNTNGGEESLPEP